MAAPMVECAARSLDLLAKLAPAFEPKGASAMAFHPRGGCGIAFGHAKMRYAEEGGSRSSFLHSNPSLRKASGWALIPPPPWAMRSVLAGDAE